MEGKLTVVEGRYGGAVKGVFTLDKGKRVQWKTQCIPYLLREAPGESLSHRPKSNSLDCCRKIKSFQRQG